VKVTRYYCDIENCKKEVTKDKKRVLDVIVVGKTRVVSPANIHVCDKCMKTVKEGNYIFNNHGTQKYYFPSKVYQVSKRLHTNIA
jgi:hypothetical protein